MSPNKPAARERRRRFRADGALRSDRLLGAAHSERRALMRASAVLGCVAVALEYDGWTPNQPDYAEAIDVARALISQSIDRMEAHTDSSEFEVALARDSDLDAHPERELSLEKLSSSIRSRTARDAPAEAT